MTGLDETTAKIDWQGRLKRRPKNLTAHSKRHLEENDRPSRNEGQNRLFGPIKTSAESFTGLVDNPT